MIYGVIHSGSGLGNQLHRYVGSRTIAEKLGEEWGMVAPELFKGKDFMDLDFGKSLSEYHIEQPSGKVIPHTNEIVVDGEMQADCYFDIDKVRQWLKVEPLDLPDNLCVINFRGREYAGVPDLFLPKEYWDLAIKEMLETNPEMDFEVHTDDMETAKRFFPHFHISVGIGYNWRYIRYAKNLILSNSSFAILPALLNEDTNVIAPKYWAGYNKGYWQLEQNKYKKFNYIHHEHK